MSFAQPGPIHAVLFDFHSTLVDQGDPDAWLDLAWQRAGRAASPSEALGADGRDELAGWVNRIWEHARDIDPDNERDLSPVRHREVYDELMTHVPAVDDDLAHALYECMLETWIPYDDSIPVLTELRRRGVRTVLVSNVGIDVRPVLDAAGLTGLMDAVVLSYEAGSVKPGAAIFEAALSAAGVAAENALMVGDSPHDDAGAALVGIRTLLLPRTSGTRHGLDLVLGLVPANVASDA
ncbi:MAG: HAD family hydrolase [Jiangellales bacterium]